MARGTGLVRRPGGKPYKHHCSECNRAAKKRCETQFHLYRCEELTCQELFTVKSPGCSIHPYSEGFNLIAKKMRKGRDPEARTEYERRAEAERDARREREAVEREKTRLADLAKKEQESQKKKQKKRKVKKHKH